MTLSLGEFQPKLIFIWKCVWFVGFFSLANLMCCFNSAANFLVYMLRGKKFRDAFLHTYGCRKVEHVLRRVHHNRFNFIIIYHIHNYVQHSIVINERMKPLSDKNCYEQVKTRRGLKRKFTLNLALRWPSYILIFYFFLEFSALFLSFPSYLKLSSVNHILSPGDAI